MQKIMIACAVLSLGAGVSAQEGQRDGTRAESAMPLRPTVRVTIESDVMKDAPYSAEVVTDSVQMLADGNRIVRHTTARVYRDREGRTRRDADRPNGTAEITISDPVAQTSWVLDTDRRTARQLPNADVMSRGVTDAVSRALEASRLGKLQVLLNGQSRALTLTGAARDLRESSTQERLAPRLMEGLRVDGLRRTQTIAAGAIGNEQPIVVTTEEWTSPDLNVLVLSEHTDPRTGTSTYKLVNVSRAEPAASLFRVPAAYTVVTVGWGEPGTAPR